MTLYVVIGPPAGGKSTWVKENARYGDLMFDMDRMLETISPITPYGPVEGHVRHMVRAMWDIMLDEITQMVDTVDVYLIETTPKEITLDIMHAHDGKLVVIDPGREVALERCRRERPPHLLKVVEEWYAKPHAYELEPICDPLTLRRAMGYERMARMQRTNAAKFVREAERLELKAEKHRQAAH